MDVSTDNSLRLELNIYNNEYASKIHIPGFVQHLIPVGYVSTPSTLTPMKILKTRQSYSRYFTDFVKTLGTAPPMRPLPNPPDTTQAKGEGKGKGRGKSSQGPK